MGEEEPGSEPVPSPLAGLQAARGPGATMWGFCGKKVHMAAVGGSRSLAISLGSQPLGFSGKWSMDLCEGKQGQQVLALLCSQCKSRLFCLLFVGCWYFWASGRDREEVLCLLPTLPGPFSPPYPQAP